jgi:hypothetical protein
MKRWLLPGLVIVVVIASLSALYLHLKASASVPRHPDLRAHLVRVPNSAYKYHLCLEAFAYTSPLARASYKTDYTFHDPFRHANDTIIPLFLGWDKQGTSVSFSVQIIVNQVATFNETISHIQVLDGISVLLPDARDNLEHSSVPQFIIRIIDRGLAVLDYTCPEQWVWKSD